MRQKKRGWIMSETDILSMLRLLDERIGSPHIEVRHRDISIRLRDILEDDLGDHRRDARPEERQTDQGAAA